MDIVARAQRAVRVDQELGYDEQRDALDAFRRVRGAGQHQMDGVLGHVVITPGDEDLLTENPVMIAVGHGAGPHRRQVGAGLRFGQVHGAGPFAADHLRQVQRLFARQTRRG
jgi:hypothetical protein